MQRFGKGWSGRRSRRMMSNTEEQLYKSDSPPDVASVRQKSQRHGKSTADKWNQ